MVRVGVTVTWVDQCGAGVAVRVLLFLQAITPQTAVRVETRAVAPQTETSTAQRLGLEEEAGSQEEEIRSSSIHFGRALGSQHPVAWHWNVSSPAIQNPRSHPY